ncbi:MAG: hypothetical protein ACR2PW_00350 [Gammaproteobacteria bacterium]
MSSTTSAQAKIAHITDGYRFSLLRHDKIALHARGSLQRVELAFNIEASRLNQSLFFQALMHSEYYNQLILGHYTMHQQAVHGPFRLDSLRAEDFIAVDTESALSEFRSLLRKERWQTDRISPQLEGNLLAWVTRRLSASQRAHENFVGMPTLFKLKACSRFNEQTQAGVSFEHEWAHALLEFHEYILVEPIDKICTLLYLVYE